MNIAILSQDAKKELTVQFCIAYCGLLSRHTLCATSATGKIVADATGLPVTRLLSAEHGGLQQVAALVACDEIDMLLYFRNSLSNVIAPQSEEGNARDLLRLCDVHNVPFATNLATAEMLIQGLDRGDLDWRVIAHPERRSN